MKNRGPVTKSYVEVGALADSTTVYRSNCPRCQLHGIWQKSVDVVERAIALHEKHVHPVQAVA